MAEPAKRQATYADLEAVPPHLVAEIIHGALVTHPRPAPRHVRANFKLGNALGSKFDTGSEGAGGWVFYPEPELHLGSHVVVPDLAGWRIERLPAPPDTAFISVAPDWVCEILSKSTQDYDRGAKRDIYGACGVQFLWLLDPSARILEVFQAAAGRWLLAGTFSGDTEVRAVPFDSVAFALGLFWPDEPSATSST